MKTLEEAYAAEGIPLPKKRKARPEAALQTKLRALCREYIDLPHLFAAHDRSENAGGMQHYWEKQRGGVAGWPDVEVPLLGGLTFRCELKAAGKKVLPGSDQARVIDDLNKLGHPTAWANSAVMFVAEAERCGVPFREGAVRRAEVIDAFLAEAARVRKVTAPKRARAEKPSARVVKSWNRAQRP